MPFFNTFDAFTPRPAYATLHGLCREACPARVAMPARQHEDRGAPAIHAHHAHVRVGRVVGRARVLALGGHVGVARHGQRRVDGANMAPLPHALHKVGLPEQVACPFRTPWRVVAAPLAEDRRDFLFARFKAGVIGQVAEARHATRE